MEQRLTVRDGPECLMYYGTTVAVSNNLKALLIITERVDERVVVGRLDTMAIMTASYLSCMRVSAWLSWLLSSSSNSLAGSVVAESRLPPKLSQIRQTYDLTRHAAPRVQAALLTALLPNLVHWRCLCQRSCMS